jgi:hypothetical protein
MRLGAGLGQGKVRNQNARTQGVQAGKEGVEFALNAGPKRAEQGAHVGWQRQLAGAGEGTEMTGLRAVSAKAELRR